MATIVSYFIFASIPCVLPDGLPRTVKWVYKPFGPKMCRELCDGAFDSFHYIVENLSCHRSGIMIKYKTSDNLVTCTRKNTSKAILMGEDICEIKDKDDTSKGLKTIQPAHSRVQQDVQHSRNITLCQACKEGKLNAVKYILCNKLEDINMRGKNGMTPVMVAVENNQEAVFDFLVSQGCDLSALTDNNNTLLHLACSGGNTEIVKKLFDTGKFDTESRNAYGMTPVMSAVMHGTMKTLNLLKIKKCNMNAVSDHGSTLLHIASIRGRVDMVEYILSQSNVDIESRASLGRTPQMLASFYGHRQVFGLLICSGAKLEVVDEEDNNVLHIACSGGHVDMVKYILALGKFHIDERGFKRQTPVMLAAKNGHKGVFDLLVSKGCNLEALSEGGSNILHMACYGGNIDLIKYTLSLDMFHVEVRGYRNYTPVFYAVAGGHREAVAFLVTKGCYLKAENTRGDNIVHMACSRSSYNMVKYVLSLDNFNTDERGHEQYTPVMYAAWAGKKRIVEFFVAKGCNLKAVNQKGDNILHIACYRGMKDVVEYILSFGALHIEDLGFGGRTPVMFATLGGHKTVISLLVTKGCNLKAVDRQGNNLLHIACSEGNEDVVRYILSLNRVNIEERGLRGYTPVMIASGKGHTAVVGLLVVSGCNVKTVDNYQNNILHIACSGGHKGTVKYLMTLNAVKGLRREKNIYSQIPIQLAKRKDRSAIARLLEG